MGRINARKDRNVEYKCQLSLIFLEMQEWYLIQPERMPAKVAFIVFGLHSPKLAHQLGALDVAPARERSRLANICLSVCNEQQDSPKPVKHQASAFLCASQSKVFALICLQIESLLETNPILSSESIIFFKKHLILKNLLLRAFFFPEKMHAILLYICFPD